MRLQVDCRMRKEGGFEPRSFRLGERRLWVLRVLERHSNAVARRFTVRTTDGRKFTLRQDLASGDWELAGVMPRAAT